MKEIFFVKESEIEYTDDLSMDSLDPDENYFANC
jgi:hypothetical protein